MTVTDDDIRERLAEYQTALKKEFEAAAPVRQAWRKMTAMFVELLERRQRDAESPMRLSEMSFAYERASGAIESSCISQVHDDPLENGWYDLETADEDLDDEVAYLESRNLLQRHPEHRQWVVIQDEGEPIEKAAKR